MEVVCREPIGSIHTDPRVGVGYARAPAAQATPALTYLAAGGEDEADRVALREEIRHAPQLDQQVVNMSVGRRPVARCQASPCLSLSLSVFCLCLLSLCTHVRLRKGVCEACTDRSLVPISLCGLSQRADLERVAAH